ncbi:MAG TPA: VOC family protein [Candidatus Mcinerneyibacterium sp.]|nr:VOC family protein [Candidatus Mcinerneyibacterium sp.]
MCSESERNNATSPVFKNVDCVRFYVPDLKDGLKFYKDKLGLNIIWKTKSAIGLGMGDKKTEVVIQNEDKWQEVDIKVDSVLKAVEEIKDAGGRIVNGPFDIKIGKCAVIKDPWNNKYVILDDSKGTFITDENGNIIGQHKTN